MKRIQRRHIDTALQFSRYALVGAMNTLLTLAVIFVAKGLFHCNPWISNAAGYLVGFINSFVWNKKWVFRSHNGIAGEALRFCVGFLICFALQFAVTWVITKHTSLGPMSWNLPGFTLSGYALATLIGMVAYTGANFVFNRSVTFRKK